MMLANWTTFLLGVGLFLSPAIFGFADHIPDSRNSFLPGIVITSVSIWKFGDPDAAKWPAILISLSGIAAVAGFLLLSSMGHTHLLKVGVVTGLPATLLGAREYIRTRPE